MVDYIIYKVRRYNYRMINKYGRLKLFHKIECITWRLLYDKGDKWKIINVIWKLIVFKINRLLLVVLKIKDNIDWKRGL